MLTRPVPTWIEGHDFVAFNYGERHARMNDGRRYISLSGASASYYSRTPKEEFPQNAYFFKTAPNMQIDTSQVREFDTLDAKLFLSDVVTVLRSKGHIVEF